MKVLEKVKRSVLLTGNNYCKQVGIRSTSKVDVKDFERIWQKYTEESSHQDKLLDRRQAKRFLKHFYSAVGEEYDEYKALLLIQEFDEFKSSTLNYDQFKKLFYKISLGKTNLTENLRQKLSVRAPIFAGNTHRNFSSSSSSSSFNEDFDEPFDLPVISIEKPEEEWNDPIFEKKEEKNRLRKRENFKILSKEELKIFIQEMLESVSAIIGLSTSESALLLRVFEWDKDKLLVHFFDDPEKWKTKAGISPRNYNDSSISNGKLEIGKEEETLEEFECPVCCDSVNYSETFMMENCGHRFCKNCWKFHMKTIVESFGIQIIQRAKCMQHGCNVLIHSDHFEMLADEKDLERFRYFFAKNFVENSSTAAFCPFDCGHVAFRIDNGHREEDGGRRPSEDVVHCLCGKSFCFECNMEAHQPVNCDQMKNWMERNEADKDSLHLITSISKPCPQCGIATDRIDGCNHMVCTQCSHEWCWQCRQSWTSHGDRTGGFYHCNMYERATDIVKQDEQAEQLREDHNRFLHHFAGWHTNDKDESGIRELKPKVLESSGNYREMTGGDPQFLEEALDTLIASRHLLKQSYVYAFFLPPGESHAKEIFEMQQAQAQGITERLAKEVMEPVEFLNRNRIVYLHQACKQFMGNLMDFFESKEGRELYSTQSTKEKKKKEKKGQTNWWICTYCTFGNPQAVHVCELCQKTRRNMEL